MKRGSRWTTTLVPAIRDLLLATPRQNDCEIARKLGITPQYVHQVRTSMRLPPLPTPPRARARPWTPLPSPRSWYRLLASAGAAQCPDCLALWEPESFHHFAPRVCGECMARRRRAQARIRYLLRTLR